VGGGLTLVVSECNERCLCRLEGCRNRVIRRERGREGGRESGLGFVAGCVSECNERCLCRLEGCRNRVVRREGGRKGGVGIPWTFTHMICFDLPFA